MKRIILLTLILLVLPINLKLRAQDSTRTSRSGERAIWRAIERLEEDVDSNSDKIFWIVLAGGGGAAAGGARVLQNRRKKTGSLWRSDS